jgi:hypothetical protein
MSQCYCDQYKAHVQQTVHIRPQQSPLPSQHLPHNGTKAYIPGSSMSSGYSPIQWALSSVGFFGTHCAHTHTHTPLCNPVGPWQFCALPSECLALWQHQQLNMSVRHASSVVDMLGAQVTICQHLSCHCWKPCTVSACFHGVPHTGSGYSLVQTHHTQKLKHTSILQRLPWFRKTIHL